VNVDKGWACGLLGWKSAAMSRRHEIIGMADLSEAVAQMAAQLTMATETPGRATS
jgi:hypothetical protein